MSCKITMSLVTESLAGNIGDDWEYSVEAKVFNPGLTGAGTINVPEHQLIPGSTQAPPGGGRAVSITAGNCATGPRVALTVDATEVDWLIDDHDSNVLNVPARGGRRSSSSPRFRSVCGKPQAFSAAPQRSKSRFAWWRSASKTPAPPYGYYAHLPVNVR